MDLPAWTQDRASPAILARTRPFTLGPLRVDPSLRTIENDERKESLEPRVMRVLVALGDLPGRVLSRDELIERCWDGLIVSETAINRTISILRRVLAALAPGAVAIETITKVGFRLVVADPGAEELARAQREQRPERGAAGGSAWTRRAVLGSCAAAATAAATALILGPRLLGPARHRPDPRAVDLYRRGDLAMKSGEPDSIRQAMSYYRQALAIDPDYADAWGALAIGYRHSGQFVREPRDAYPRLVRSAALRALALDPRQPDARVALIAIDSDLGRWSEIEAGLRDVIRASPDYWFGHGLLDLVLQDVGRFEDGLVERRRQMRIDPMIPIAWSFYARGLHFAGRDHEADLALDRAFSRWPAHPVLWMARYRLLLGSKRYSDAAAFVRDPRTLPEVMPPASVARLGRVADALAGRRGTGALIDEYRAERDVDAEALPGRVILLAELGAGDEALAELSAYFFGGRVNGQALPVPGPLDQRPSVILFAPSLAPLRGDARFAALLERSGLERYWRATATLPDFRRAS